jgi:hypothetical protein
MATVQLFLPVHGTGGSPTVPDQEKRVGDQDIDRKTRKKTYEATGWPFKERRGYCHLKKEALDRTMWRAHFGRGFGPAVRETAK